MRSLSIKKSPKKKIVKKLPLKKMSEAYEIGNKSTKKKYVGERKRNSRYMD
jgi:hypothetical protein